MARQPSKPVSVWVQRELPNIDPYNSAPQTSSLESGIQHGNGPPPPSDGGMGAPPPCKRTESAQLLEAAKTVTPL